MTNPKSKIENKNSNPKITIFITSYNYAKYISQAVESVINQSNPNWNLIIIDNCSTDNTLEIVENYLQKDSRISWKKREKNIGGIQNIFHAFAEIDADYICSLSADDWLEKNFVEDVLTAFTENPEIPFVALGWKLFLQDKNAFQNYAIPFPENFRGKVFLTPYLTFGNFVCLNTIVFNKQTLKLNDDFEQMLQYLEKVKTRQNIEVFMMKFLEAKFGASYFINGFYGVCRNHDNNLSNSQNKNQQGFLEAVSEPLFYCYENFANNSKNSANVANKYMSLISLLERTGISYKTSAEWLLSDLGKPFAEQFGNLDLQFIRENALEKSLLCVAICVWSAFIFNCNYAGWSRKIDDAQKQLSLWIMEMQQKYKLKTIEKIYREANKLYEGCFMPFIE